MSTVKLKSRRSVLRGMRKLREEMHVIRKAMDGDFFAHIVGHTSSWFKPNDVNTEWDMLVRYFKDFHWWKLSKIFIEDLFSVMIIPIGFMLYARSRLAMHNAVEGEEFAANSDACDEEWWYLNGIGVNSDLQRMNGKQLAKIFEKKINLFYNPTSGLLFDLFLCMTGLTGHKTHAARRLSEMLINTLSNHPTRKVILIAHSGGAILTANVVRHIIKHGFISYLKRLEVYTFGSPVILFESRIDPETYQRVPYYEHYVNSNDVIAQIGTLRLDNRNWWAVGKVYTAQAEGHFFGEHYLSNFVRGKYVWLDGVHDGAKLYEKVKNTSQEKRY